jgi:hypothetical protein
MTISDVWESTNSNFVALADKSSFQVPALFSSVFELGPEPRGR